MSSVDARSTEPVSITLAASGVGVTGASLRYDVTRVVAGVVGWLNRATSTFVTTVPADGDRYRTLAEVDAVNAAGLYADAAGGVNVAAITNPTVPTATTPAVYRVTYYQTAPVARLLCTEEIRAGVDDNVRRQLTNREALSAGGTGTVYRDDGVTVEATYTVTDVTGSAISLAAGDPARRSAQVPA